MGPNSLVEEIGVRSLSIKLLLLLQLLLVVLFSAVLAWQNAKWGRSCFIGAGVMGLANGYFMRILFAKRDFDPKRILINFYRGELGKLVILGLGSALCAKYLALTWWAYILGVAIVQLSLWLTPMLMKENRLV